MSQTIKKQAINADGEIMEPTFYLPELDEHGWGTEKLIINRDDYAGKLLCFKKGGSFSGHLHLTRSESYFLAIGLIKLEYFDLTNADKLERIVKQGECVHIPKGCYHKVTALEESTIIEFSSRYHKWDNYRITKGDTQLNQV